MQMTLLQPLALSVLSVMSALMSQLHPLRVLLAPTLLRGTISATPVLKAMSAHPHPHLPMPALVDGTLLVAPSHAQSARLDLLVPTPHPSSLVLLALTVALVPHIANPVRLAHTVQTLLHLPLLVMLVLTPLPLEQSLLALCAPRVPMPTVLEQQAVINALKATRVGIKVLLL